MNNIPRSEHPNPQFMRTDWLCLNGEWQFQIDKSDSGEARGLYKTDAVLNDKITVPFCPESKLSGVECKDFMNAVWYQRKIDITREQLSGRILLHFGAIDFLAKIYVNGELACTHAGGYVEFYADITDRLTEGENVLTVYAHDDVRDRLQPRGKQSEQYYSHKCDYTRTTGIWQTVWLEFVPVSHIKSFRIYPNVSACEVSIQSVLEGCAPLKISVFYEGKLVGEKALDCCRGTTTVNVPLSEKHLWEVGCGRLYDIEMTYGEDEVKSYFGLREVALDGYKFLINGKSVFQRLVLDQGFYPDGIYTAPCDGELLADIERSLACGFNGARLHQKVFEPRFLYHADKAGYLVWGEYASWGLDHTKAAAVYPILYDWLAELERDFNHPSIVGWCPFNETWDQHHRRQNDEVLRAIYRATKAIDTTRPCIDTSGNYHVETDIFDIHDYDQNPVTFRERYNPLISDGTLYDKFADRQFYTIGQATFVSEYGGIQWSPDRNDGWGYGNAPRTEQEFIERYKGLTEVLLDNSRMFGFCYTQLTDIEQEQNGLYTYDRVPKFDLATIHSITSRKAAIED